MKRRVIGLLAACSLAAFVSSAVAQEAYSANAIGVIKKTVPAKSYAFISMPLDSTTTVENYFLDTPIAQMPVGSTVYYWDLESNPPKWSSLKRDSRKGWGAAASNLVIGVGQPMFVQNPDSTPVELIFSGEVPSDASLQIGIPSKAYQTVANPYPVPFVWGDSDLAKTANAGSTVYMWKEGAWVSGKKDSRKGWSEFATNVIAPGDGLFFFETGNSDYYWTVAKPYSWPE